MAAQTPLNDQRTFYETPVNVPVDAAIITYDVSLVGNGRIWVDNVSLEIVSP